MTTETVAEIVGPLNTIIGNLETLGRAPEALTALLELCALYRTLANKDLGKYKQPLATALRRTAALLLESNQRDDAISFVLEFIGLCDPPFSSSSTPRLLSSDLQQLLVDLARHANDWKNVSEQLTSRVSEVVEATKIQIAPELMSAEALDAVARIESLIDEWSLP